MNKTAQKTILVVDDSKTVCKLIGNDLMSHGYVVHCANAMEEALLFKEQKSFDLLITDLVMPGMGGIEGIKIVRGRYPDIGIIAMTGGSGTDDANKLLAKARFVGADDLLLKPFDIEEMRRKVEVHTLSFSAGKTKPRKILVIDDSTTIQKVVLKMLAKGGMNAVCVSSIEEALERLDIVRVDLIITDIFMPGKGGIVGIRELRENWPDTRIIAISGGLEGLGGAGEALEAAKRIGADAGLQKPFEADALIATIEAVLRPARMVVG